MSIYAPHTGFTGHTARIMAFVSAHRLISKVNTLHLSAVSSQTQYNAHKQKMKCESLIQRNQII